MRLVSIFILFILMGIGVQAQVSFVVKASKKTLGINERLRIDFEMNEEHRGSNSNVSKWFELDKFSIPFNDPFRGVLRYEERGYEYLESDIRTITKP